ncbi:hypothetical protein ACOSQ4_021343 [Xanthoceras sorbifolium]
MQCGVVVSFLLADPLAPLFSELSKLKVVNFLDRILWLFSVKGNSFVTQFLVAAWLSWCDRNNCLLGGKQLKSADVWSLASAFISDFSSACRSICVVTLQSQGRGLVWLPPPSGVFKLNVNASVFKGGRQVGTGSVVSRSDGSLVSAAASVFHRGFAVNVAEALAVLDGLSLATSKGLLPLLDECDALNVVNLYLGIISSRLEIMNVIRDIRRLLLQFPCCSLAHVPRSCNTAAHEVAKFTLLAPVSVFWEVSFPN